MAQDEVEIVLVENDPADAELALHALRGEKLGHRIEVLRDGEEALDFMLCRGAYSNRSLLSSAPLDLAGPETAQAGRAGSAARD